MINFADRRISPRVVLAPERPGCYTRAMKPQRVTCPVCKGTQRVRPLDENFERTLAEEECLDCPDGSVTLIPSR